MLDDSSAVFARKIRGGEFVLKRVLKADMGADASELADLIRKKYMLNRKELTNFKGDMAKFVCYGATSLFFVKGEKSPHLFLLNNFQTSGARSSFRICRNYTGSYLRTKLHIAVHSDISAIKN